MAVNNRKVHFIDQNLAPIFVTEVDATCKIYHVLHCLAKFIVMTNHSIKAGSTSKEMPI